MRNVGLLLVYGIPGTGRISAFIDDLLHYTAPSWSCDYPCFEGEESRAQRELLLFKYRSTVQLIQGLHVPENPRGHLQHGT